MGLVRLFLALVVAVDHWRVIVLHEQSIFLDDIVKFGFNAGYAVMFFYVISGFLITYTLTRNYKRDRSGLAAFYSNRFIRIFSLYWPMVILAFLFVASAWPKFVAASLPDKFTAIFLIGQDWRLAFGSYPTPYGGGAISGLHQAWTLGAELTFYLMAPLFIRSWKIGGVVLIASFALRAFFVFQNGTDVQEVWTYAFVGSTYGFFMLGHLACLFGRYLANRWLGVALTVASFAVMHYGGSYASFDTPRFWVSVVLFSVAVPGLFEATKNVRWMNALGDLSYPVYLVHTLVLILFGPWLLNSALSFRESLGPLGAGYLSLVAFSVACVLAAALVHRFLEIPTAWAMRTALQGWKTLPSPQR
jgi:peptidoglycan/LPS O-acetylase OafA/YrhL